jgi:hypothetical protein
MGGAGSIFLPSLTEFNGDAHLTNFFQNLECECISRNLNANEIYDLLSSKYEEILCSQKTSSKSGKSSKKTRNVSLRRSSLHSTLPTKSSHRHNGTSSEPSSLYHPHSSAASDRESTSTHRLRKGSTDSFSSLHHSSRSKHAASLARQARKTAVRHTASTRLKALEAQQNLSKPSKKPPVPRRLSTLNSSKSHDEFVKNPATLHGTASLSGLGAFPEEDASQCTHRNSLSSDDSLTVLDTGSILELRAEGSLTEAEEDHLPHAQEDREDSEDEDEGEHDDDKFTDLRTAPTSLLPLQSNAPAASSTPVINPSGRRSSILDDVVMPPQVFECRLCQRKFGSGELLATHISFSQVHQHSIQRRRETYHRALLQETDQLGKLLRKAIQHFQRVYETKKSFLEGRITMERMQWQRAIGKVLLTFTATRVDHIMDDLVHTEALRATMSAKAAAAAAVNADGNVAKAEHICAKRLLLTTNRFFWRTKSRFTIHVLHHPLSSQPQQHHSHTEATVGKYGNIGINASNGWLEVICVLLPEWIHITTSLNSIGNAPNPAATESSKSETSAGSERRFWLAVPDCVAHYHQHQLQQHHLQHHHQTVSLTEIAQYLIQQHLHIDFAGVQGGEVTPIDALFFDDLSSSVAVNPNAASATAVSRPSTATVVENMSSTSAASRVKECSKSCQLCARDTPVAEIHLYPSLVNSTSTAADAVADGATSEVSLPAITPAAATALYRCGSYEAMQKEMQDKLQAIASAQSELEQAVQLAESIASKVSVRMHTPPSPNMSRLRGSSPFNSGNAHKLGLFIAEAGQSGLLGGVGVSGKSTGGEFGSTQVRVQRQKSVIVSKPALA